MAKVLLIGANRGIGLALARALRDRGDAVIAGCRQPSPELEGLAKGDNPITIEAGVEVTDSASLEDLARAVARSLGEAKLDLLIHNAGILEGSSLDDLDFDSLRRQYEVNALGPLRTVVALRPLLAEGAKIALVTSRMGSVADNDSGGSYGYRMSKAALNMAGKSLAIDLRPQGISVALLHPGWVRTDMTGHSGLIDAETSARGLLARIDALRFETSGGFWHQDGQELPW